MALQNLTGALENDKLRDTFSNCGYKYFLNQSGIDAGQLRQIQDLLETEYEFVIKPSGVDYDRMSPEDRHSRTHP